MMYLQNNQGSALDWVLQIHQSHSEWAWFQQVKFPLTLLAMKRRRYKFSLSLFFSVVELLTITRRNSRIKHIFSMCPLVSLFSCVIYILGSKVF